MNTAPWSRIARPKAIPQLRVVVAIDIEIDEIEISITHGNNAEHCAVDGPGIHDNPVFVILGGIPQHGVARSTPQFKTLVAIADRFIIKHLHIIPLNFKAALFGIFGEILLHIRQVARSKKPCFPPNRPVLGIRIVIARWLTEAKAILFRQVLLQGMVIRSSPSYANYLTEASAALIHSDLKASRVG